MTRYTFPRLLVPAGLLALSLLPTGCKKEEGPPPSPPTVEVVAVTQRDVPIYRESVGTLAGDVNATISAQVTGYLVSREYTEGTAVTNGQVLFRIDPKPFQAELDKAQSQLAQAQATEKKYALMVERYRPLAKTEAISKQELDDAIQNQAAALANVQAASAAVEQANLNLGFTTILSPANGIAGLASPQAQVGNLVGPSTGALTSVTTVDPMRVYFTVDQRLLTELQERTLAEGRKLGTAQGPPLELTLATGSIYPSKGRIRFKDNQVDVKTGTVRLVGEFSNTNLLLVPGMFVSVRALIGTVTNALLVPQRAVTEMQGRYLVAVVGSDNKVGIRPVTTGERPGQEWVIMGNVKVGDRVVAEGIQKVRDGVVVNPVPFAEKIAAAPAGQVEEKKP
jgi:membrane fusion protein, multidrug efflux system